MNILLMGIDRYWCLLLAIGGYWWLLMIIVLVAIGGYSLGDY
jgi:hypothetical protein